MTSIDRDLDEVLGPVPAAEAPADGVVELRPAHLALVRPEAAKTPQEIEFERCRPWLEPALEGGRHTLADVVNGLKSGRAQLWPGKACAMVTEVHEFPTGRAIQVWLAGGDGEELQAMQAGVESWARLMGCAEVIIEGRQGWSRRLKAAGFELYAVCLRKAL